MTSMLTAQPPGPTGRATPPTSLTIGALCLGGLVAALTQTMVIPIQGQLPGLLDAAPTDTTWVLTITLLAAAVAMPIVGRLADLLGKQRILVASAAVLAVGSLVCATADSLAPMLVGRTLQGLSMAFIPVGISLMREVVPAERAGSAVAAMSATMGVGGAVGLPLSAWIVEVADWHVLFWVATGAAVAVTVLSWFAIPRVRDAVAGRLDVLGAIGLAAGLISFLVGVSKASTWGWGDGRTLGWIAAGLVIVVGWVFFELRQDDPLVDLRTTAQRPVLLTNLAGVAVGFGQMAHAITLPQLLQLPEVTGHGMGQTVLAAGLWMAPGGLMMMVFAPVSSRLMASVGARRTLMLGALVLSAGYFASLVLMGAPWQLLIASCIASAGVGIGYAAMPTLILDAVPAEESASAVSVNSLMRSLGTTLASALMGTVLTSHLVTAGGLAVPSESAFRVCFLIGAVAALVGVVIASFATAGKDRPRPQEIA